MGISCKIQTWIHDVPSVTWETRTNPTRPMSLVGSGVLRRRRIYCLASSVRMHVDGWLEGGPGERR